MAATRPPPAAAPGNVRAARGGVEGAGTAPPRPGGPYLAGTHRVRLMLRHLAFRSRLLLILSLFALVPAIAVTAAWGVVFGTALPLLSENAAWERVASSGTAVLDSLQGANLTPGQRRALEAHEQELEESLTRARQVRFIARNFAPVILVGAVLGLAILGVIASRVAGHLSRQLSRPLNELVGWAERIARGDPLPETAPPRGAREFRVLRERMRTMSDAIAEGRDRALEAERLRAFRESARRFAHELKNPLTPIQFAVRRLERAEPAGLEDVVDVLRTETERLDRMARAFSQFGRLPEGAPSEIDMGELVRYTARASVPASVPLEVEVAPGTPLVEGHHDALQRAFSNVLLNAADACAAGGGIHVRVAPVGGDGSSAVSVSIRDSGCGIPAERLATIWEPYVTHKEGGTGLGLAIARQAILAHHGSVSADSTPGSGTEIRFVIPVRAAATQGEVQG